MPSFVVSMIFIITWIVPAIFMALYAGENTRLKSRIKELETMCVRQVSPSDMKALRSKIAYFAEEALRLSNYNLSILEKFGLNMFEYTNNPHRKYGLYLKGAYMGEGYFNVISGSYAMTDADMLLKFTQMIQNGLLDKIVDEVNKTNLKMLESMNAIMAINIPKKNTDLLIPSQQSSSELLRAV